MKFKLRDAHIVDIVPFNPKIPASAFLKFINDLIEEDIYLIHDRKYTYKQEKEWKKNQLEAIKKNNLIALVALSGKRVVANLEARKDKGKLSDNVSLGVAVAKDFRGAGLGEKMIRMLIAEAKKKLKPKNMHLTVIAENKPALSLYHKVGFKRVIGRYPKWFKHKGRYIDQLILLLVEK